MSATGRLLAFAAAEHDLPDSARAAAERLLADTLAVGAAGAASEEAAKLFRAIEVPSPWPPRRGLLPEEGQHGHQAPDQARGDALFSSRLLGTARAAPAETAALWNGFAIHCLEWDAVHEPAVVHALSVVTAALLALIDERGGCDEEEAMTALAVGVDLASGFGVAATGAMRFFRPATAGVIGAALAGARIAGLPGERFADILGLAYSQAAGTMQAHVEGSVALPLQIGLAARAAVTAVHLAKAGLGGPHDVLEGPFGYSALIEPLDLRRYPPGERWLIEEVSVKPYPSGRASHGALAELEALHQEGVTLDQVESLRAEVPPLIHRLVARAYKRDMDAGYARLCLPILAPLMLRDGRIDPRAFTGETYADPQLARLAERVEVALDGNADPNALGPQRLTVRLHSGETVERRIDATLGSPARPMSEVQAKAKRELAHACAGEAADPRLFEDAVRYLVTRRPGFDPGPPAAALGEMADKTSRLHEGGLGSAAGTTGKAERS